MFIILALEKGGQWLYKSDSMIVGRFLESTFLVLSLSSNRFWARDDNLSRVLVRVMLLLNFLFVRKFAAPGKSSRTT